LNQGSRIKDQGSRIKDQGSNIKDKGSSLRFKVQDKVQDKERALGMV
jgi:hypothetical protein